jgi:triosephosphate isomerase
MGETGDLIKKKLQMAFDAQIIPILCIGESIRDKEGQYLDFLKKQIEESLSGLPKKNLLGLMIAYEPIWAIGKSYREAMTPTDIHEITLFIKKVAGELLGKDIANSFKILYGAAVEAENASDIMRIGNVEGFLVGHASLVADQFGTILKSADMRR